MWEGIEIQEQPNKSGRGGGESDNHLPGASEHRTTSDRPVSVRSRWRL